MKEGKREGSTEREPTNRRIFVPLLTILILASVPLAEAQPGKGYHVGVLAPPGKTEERLHIKGLRDGLREAGYIEGKNLKLNIPIVKAYDELRLAAKGYVEIKADVIVTSGGTATGIAS